MRTLGIAAGGLALVLALTAVSGPVRAQAPKYVGSDGAVRVALAKQPLSPNGPSKGPTTMADGGIQRIWPTSGPRSASTRRG